MSGRRSWRRLGSRPIAERERVRAFGIVAAVLIAAAGLLFAVPDGGPSLGPATELEYRSAPPPGPSPTTTPPAMAAGVGESAARVAARRFLPAYLALVYGAPAGSGRARFPSASRPLADRLARSKLRVSPAARRRRPRIAGLDVDQLGGVVTVAARIADGSVAYSIDLTVERIGGRWLVTRVGGD